MCGIFSGFSEGLGAVCASSESAAETRGGRRVDGPACAFASKEGGYNLLVVQSLPLQHVGAPLRGAAVRRLGLDKKMSGDGRRGTRGQEGRTRLSAARAQPETWGAQQLGALIPRVYGRC